MLIRREGLEERRKKLPDTVGKTSLFVKEILEKYGQDGDYRFDPASLVYLLPEKPKEEELKKKEPSEERVREYILRERETVKLATQTERTRDFVTRIVERAAIPSGVELLRQRSLRQQILVQTQRLLEECRIAERNLIREQNEEKSRLVQKITELIRETAEDGAEPAALPKALPHEAETGKITEPAGAPSAHKGSDSEKLAYQIAELIYETETKEFRNEGKGSNAANGKAVSHSKAESAGFNLSISQKTAENDVQETQNSREILTEKITELLRKSDTVLPGERRKQQEGSLTGAETITESVDVLRAHREITAEELAHQITELVYATEAEERVEKETNVSRKTTEIDETDRNTIRGIAEIDETDRNIIRGITENRGREIQNFREILTEKITELLRESDSVLSGEQRKQQERPLTGAETITESVDVLRAHREITAEELAHQIAELVYVTETEERVEKETNVSRKTTKIDETDRNVIRGIAEIDETDRNIIRGITEIDETDRNIIREITENRGREIQNSREILTEKITELLRTATEENTEPDAETMTESMKELHAYRKISSEELAYRIAELVYATEAEERFEKETNVSRKTTKIDETDRNIIRGITEIDETDRNIIRGITEIDETDRNVIPGTTGNRGREIQNFREILTEKITELLRKEAEENMEPDAETITESMKELHTYRNISSEELAYRIAELVYETKAEERVEKETNVSRKTTKIAETDINTPRGITENDAQGMQNSREVLIEKITELLREEEKREEPFHELRTRRKSFSEELAYQIAELVYETRSEEHRTEDRESDAADVKNIIYKEAKSVESERNVRRAASESMETGADVSRIKSRKVLIEKITELLRETEKENAESEDREEGQTSEKEETSESVSELRTYRESTSKELAYRIAELVYETKTQYRRGTDRGSNEPDVPIIREVLTEKITKLLQKTAEEYAKSEVLPEIVRSQPDTALREEPKVREGKQPTDIGKTIESAGELQAYKESYSERLAYQIAELVYGTTAEEYRSKGKEAGEAAADETTADEMAVVKTAVVETAGRSVSRGITESYERKIRKTREALTEKITKLLQEAAEEKKIAETSPERLAYQIAELVYETRKEYRRSEIQTTDETNGPRIITETYGSDINGNRTITETHGSDVYVSRERMESYSREIQKTREVLAGKIAELLRDAAAEDAKRSAEEKTTESFNAPRAFRKRFPEELAYQITELIYETSVTDGRRRQEASENIREFQKEIRILEKRMERWQRKDGSELEIYRPEVSENVQKLIRYRRTLENREDHVWFPLPGEIKNISGEPARMTAESPRIQEPEQEALRVLEIYQNSGPRDFAGAERPSLIQYYEDHSRKAEQLQKEQKEQIRRLEEKTVRQEEQFQELKAHHRQLKEQLENSRKQFAENTEQKTLQKFQEQLRLERMRRGLA